jgi:hypothetical protein
VFLYFSPYFLLIAERDRLNRAIEALQGPTTRRGRPLAASESDTIGRKKTPSERRCEAKDGCWPKEAVGSGQGCEEGGKQTQEDIKNQRRGQGSGIR